MKHTLLLLFLSAALVQADPLGADNKPASTLPPLGSSMDGAKATRRITIRGKFDADLIKIQNGSLWIEHVAFDKPTDITINGVHWKTQWNGKASEHFEFKPPLEPFGQAKVEVKKLQGRSEIESVELPSDQNQQTLSVKLIDKPGGVDTYELRIRW